jgi:SAM-dependent methyltransferase
MNFPSPAAVRAERMKNVYDELAARDPLWAILPEPDKIGKKWDASALFESGRVDIQDTLDWIQSNGLRLRTGRALDFGCGVGRLTQALAEHFDSVDGTDSSPQMIDIANKYNKSSRHPGTVNFWLNGESDLSLFDSSKYDLVISFRVLTAIPPALSLKFVSEFYRLAKSGGVVVFAVPDRVELIHEFRNKLVEMLPQIDKPAVRLWGMFSSAWRRDTGYQKEGLAPHIYALKERQVCDSIRHSDGSVRSIRRVGGNRKYLTCRN